MDTLYCMCCKYILHTRTYTIVHIHTNIREYYSENTEQLLHLLQLKETLQYILQILSKFHRRMYRMYTVPLLEVFVQYTFLLE